MRIRSLPLFFESRNRSNSLFCRVSGRKTGIHFSWKRYNRTFGLAVVFGASCLTASADDLPWYGAEYQECSNGSTQAIVECMATKIAAWDERLNAAYRELMAREQPDQRERLRTAQRLWVQYRDANCDYYAAGEGTISRIEAAECVRMLTMERARELEQDLTP